MRKAIFLVLAALLLNPASPPGEEPPALSAECAVLAGENGEILLAKNADARHLIASTTKLLTALVALEHSELTDEVEIPAACCGIEGSSMYLQAGEKYTVKELLTGLLLASGNDAALALALHCGGSEEQFVAWMNEKAAALGMRGSRFANPHGLDDPEHYGTAADLAKLMAACLRAPALLGILKQDNAAIREQYYGNHNKLLGSCRSCIKIHRTLRNTDGGVTTFLTNLYALLQSAIRCQRNISLTRLHVFILVSYDDQRTIACATHRLDNKIVRKVSISITVANRYENVINLPVAVCRNGDFSTFIARCHRDGITLFNDERLFGRLGTQVFVRLTADESCHDGQCSQYCYDISCLHIVLSLYI